MKKELKISCYDKENLKEFFVCSGCFFKVNKYDNFCFNCGAMLARSTISTSIGVDQMETFDFLTSIRKKFIESDEEDI